MIDIKTNLINNKNNTKRDINKKKIYEKVVHAFALLEELSNTNLEYVFKGGTSLLLHFNKPARFSIDVDINMPEKYFFQNDKLLSTFKTFKPFNNCKPDKRKRKKKLKCLHYIFPFNSELDKDEPFIMLDILFHDYNFNSRKLEIKNKYLLSKGKHLCINTISITDLIADKLTAFAPNTIGIKYSDKNNKGGFKTCEIIKQMYDLSILLEQPYDLNRLCVVYKDIAKFQIEAELNKYKIEDCLKDTIKTCELIISGGKMGRNHFKELINGMKTFNHYIVDNCKIDIFDLKICALKIDILSFSILKNLNKKCITAITLDEYYKTRLNLSSNEIKSLNLILNKYPKLKAAFFTNCIYRV